MSVATTITKDVAYTGQKPVNAQPRGAEVLIVPVPINFPAAAPVTNDTHALIRLLPNVEVVDWTLMLDDLDDASSADLTLGELDDELDDIAVTYKSSITLGQAGGLQRAAAATEAADMRAIGAATLANERVIGLKWAAAAGTYVASQKGLLLLYVRN